jgi:transcription initiation factor TFIIIB Brf1 subunit/transcription initiation factor TFIIB
MELIWPSAFVVQSIHVVARLGLADILGPEPRTIDELAKATRVHAPSLKRVLRAWAARNTTGALPSSSTPDGSNRSSSLAKTLRRYAQNV